MNSITLAVQKIKDTISAQDVGRLLGLEIRHGRCQCPIHGGKDFNCVLYKGNRGFYCHVCKSGGDVIRFAQLCNGTPFKDTVMWLSDAFNLGIDFSVKLDPDAAKQAEIALKRRRQEIDFIDWKKRMSFDLSLSADEIVKRLETIRDENVPKTPDEPWNVAFRMSVCLLPEAQKFADDAAMNCIEMKS